MGIAFVVKFALPVYQLVTFDAAEHIENRLNQAGGLEVVKAWAIAEISQHPPQSLAGQSNDTTIVIPGAVSKSGVHWAKLIPAQINGQATTLLYAEFGGGFHHFGLLFGSGDELPEFSDLSGSFLLWDEGVWFRDEAMNVDGAYVR